MEEGRHDIVGVAGEDGDTGTGGRVPDANGLVIRRRHDPRHLVVELDRANVIQVAVKREQAASSLRSNIPDFDLIIVAASHEQGARWVERDSTNGSYDKSESDLKGAQRLSLAIVLIETVDKGAHLIVPQLDTTIVQRGGEQWPRWVER